MIHHVKQNDTRPHASTVLKRGKTIVDLTSATSVTFKMRRIGRVENKVSSAAVVIGDPTLGAVEYEWTTVDTDAIGNFRASWVVLWSDTTRETFPTVSYDVVHVDPSLET